MSEQQDQPGWPSNNPPADEENPLLKINPEKLVVVDSVAAVMELHYKHLTDRADELLSGINGWITDHTAAPARGAKPTKPSVGDEQDLNDTTDRVNQVKDFLKDEVEVARKKVKKPIDLAVSDIQDFFAEGLTKRLKHALTPIVDAQSLALIAKEEQERKRLRQEAWEKAQEANRLALQSARATGVVARESLLDRAGKIEDEAERLLRASEGSVADLSRIRTDMQQVTGLRSTWKFEVTNLIELLMAIVAGRQDLLACVKIDEVCVNSLIKGKDGVRAIPGLHIFEEKTAR